MTDWKILLVFCMIVGVLASIWLAWLTIELWKLRDKTRSHEKDLDAHQRTMRADIDDIKANTQRARALAHYLGVSFCRDEGDWYFCKKDEEDL